MSQIPDSTTSRRALLGGALSLGGAAMAISAATGEASASGIPADPSSDFFLTIPGIPGESNDAQFPADDRSPPTWSFGVTSTAIATGTGASTGPGARPCAVRLRGTRPARHRRS